MKLLGTSSQPQNPQTTVGQTNQNAEAPRGRISKLGTTVKSAFSSITPNRVATLALTCTALFATYVAANANSPSDMADAFNLATAASSLILLGCGTANIALGNKISGTAQLALSFAAGVTVAPLVGQVHGVSQGTALAKTFGPHQPMCDVMEGLFPEVISSPPTTPSMHIVFGSTYIKGNKLRDEMSKLVDGNHAEYAALQRLEHRVVDENLLKDACCDSETGKAKDCVPYWNKIQVLRNWLKEPSNGKEEWYILADDDMLVMNMDVSPFESIHALRRGHDTSVIVARDVIPWKNNDWDLSVNTGLMMVRKDAQSIDFFERIWAHRDDLVGKGADCQSLGTCRTQDVLHEQEAMARVIAEDRSIIDKTLTVISTRDVYDGKEIAVNTFNRQGCFVGYKPNCEVEIDVTVATTFAQKLANQAKVASARQVMGCKAEKLDFKKIDAKYPEGNGRHADWLVQTAGVPVKGWYCEDFDNGKPPGPVRQDRIEMMLKEVVGNGRVPVESTPVPDVNPIKEGEEKNYVGMIEEKINDQVTELTTQAKEMVKAGAQKVTLGAINRLGRFFNS